MQTKKVFFIAWAIYLIVVWFSWGHNPSVEYGMFGVNRDMINSDELAESMFRAKIIVTIVWSLILAAVSAAGAYSSKRFFKK